MRGFEGISIQGGMIITAPPATVTKYLLYDLIAYEWDNTTGFGSALTTPNDAPLPSGGIGFNEDGTALLIQTTNSPYIEGYAWNGSGWGTKYSAPDTIYDNRTFNSSRDTIKFSHAGNVAFVGISQYGGSPPNSASLVAYNWNNVSGFGSLLTALTLSTFSDLNSVTVHPNDDAIIMAGSSLAGAGRVLAYRWNNTTGLGANYTLPANIQTYGRITSVAFSPDGNYVAFGVTNSPHILVYPWNSTTGFGSKYSDPASLPAHFSAPFVKFSQESNAVFTIGAPNGGVLGLNAWAWSVSGFGTKYSNPALATTTFNGASRLDFSSDGSAIAMSGPNGPEVYRWDSATGFGSRFTPPNDIGAARWPQFS